MRALDLLKAASAVGLTVQADGHQLILEGPTPPPEFLLRELTRSKASLLRHLNATPARDRGPADKVADDSFEGEQFKERAALIEFGAGVPRAWAEGFARLDLATPADGFDLDHWRTLIDDGGKFLDKWGTQAAKLGWSAEDVFGVHPLAPATRYDTAGLILLIDGGEVVAIDAKSASIKTMGSGSILIYLRKPRQGAITLWELCASTHNTAEID